MQSKNKSKSQTKFSLNDENFFDEVFNSLYTPLVFFANGIIKNDQIISEYIVQDVFTNLLLKKEIFENYLSPKSYLYISVKNSCYNHSKSNKVRGLYAENKKVISTNTTESFLEPILKEEIQYEFIAHNLNSVFSIKQLREW